MIKLYNVIIVGGGVIGGLITRELSKYKLSVCLLEKENDVCMGQSKANSGIVHAGFDAKENSLKAKFNVSGNAMMPDLARELGVKYVNNGSLVVAYSEEEFETLKELLKRGEYNGVKGLEIIGKDKLTSVEPNIAKEAVGALFAPTGGIICPYQLTVAAIGNAMDNGAELKTNFEVVKIERISVGKENGYKLISKKGETVEGKIVINCAGIGSQRVAECVGDYSFKIGGRKGEYLLLDKENRGFVNHTIFRVPTKHGKGVLVTRTVDDNVLFGPTATVCDGNDTSTTRDGMNFIVDNVKKMMNNPPLQGVITSFAGVRAYCDRHDFIIEESKSAENLFNVSGIESPGLTSSPAIAEYVVSELVGKKITLIKKENFNGKRKSEYFFSNLPVEQKNAIIKENPSYGKIVCRCEKVTEGEIIAALTENPKATDVDGIKRRTRAGMGRCQGGFCQPSVMEIIADTLKIPMDKVSKKGGNSVIVKGRTK